MPQKDAVVKEAIQDVIGTSRLGRKKIIVKVQKKHPYMGAAMIRRVYEKEGLSLYKRMKMRWSNSFGQDLYKFKFVFIKHEGVWGRLITFPFC